jgi:hypothetical protein
MFCLCDLFLLSDNTSCTFFVRGTNNHLQRWKIYHPLRIMMRVSLSIWEIWYSYEYTTHTNKLLCLYNKIHIQ